MSIATNNNSSLPYGVIGITVEYAEDEVGESVIRSEQDPVAVGEVFEGHGPAATCERVGSRQNGDELLPPEADDWPCPLLRAGANRDVARACPHRVFECSAVLVLAKRKRRGWVSGTPELKGRR